MSHLIDFFNFYIEAWRSMTNFWITRKVKVVSWIEKEKLCIINWISKLSLSILTDLIWFTGKVPLCRPFLLRILMKINNKVFPEEKTQQNSQFRGSNIQIMFCLYFDQKWKLALFPLAVSLNTWWGVLRLYVYLYTVHCTDQTEFIKDKHSSISLCCKTFWALCLKPALSSLQKGDQFNFDKKRQN